MKRALLLVGAALVALGVLWAGCRRLPSEREAAFASADGLSVDQRVASMAKPIKDECLQRALNLIPDENVLLLAGILLDKSQGRAVLEAVFNDILNRDDQAKLLILKNLYKDRAHPCWADAAWVLDVTGEIPSGAQSPSPSR